MTNSLTSERHTSRADKMSSDKEFNRLNRKSKIGKKKQKKFANKKRRQLLKNTNKI